MFGIDDYDIQPGQKVKVTITGTVTGGLDVSHSYTQKVIDDNGCVHHIYFGATSGGIKNGCVYEKLESFTKGQAYQDADGDVFFRANDSWIDSDGIVRRDAYPSRPMTALVKKAA
jgi:hypothetical protein